MIAHGSRQGAFPAVAPPLISTIPDLRLLFRYRVAWQDFFLSRPDMPGALYLTAWVALHDTADRRVARPEHGGMTTVLEGLHLTSAGLLVPGAARGGR